MQTIGQTDVQVDTKRAGDLFVHETADVTTVDPANEFTHQPTERERVVAVGGSRRPPWLGVGQRTCDPHVVENLVERQRFIDRVQAGTVRHHFGNGDVLFAVRRELGPVVGHRLRVINESAVDAHRQRSGGNALRGAEDDLQIVVGISNAAIFVDPSGNEVDNETTAMNDRNAASRFTRRGKV